MAIFGRMMAGISLSGVTAAAGVFSMRLTIEKAL
jgi:hypothetical protein